MNSQERELLTAFLQQMNQAQAGQKDTEAEALIKAACAQQPDSGYLLIQRAMQLDYTLQATQAQVAKLQAEVEQLRSGARGGFIDSANAWGRGTPAAPAAAPAAAAGALQPQAQSGQGARAPASSWGSGMLGTVATTAAGVVAGSFLFQGIQNLMGHHNTNAESAGKEGANALQPIAENTAPDNDYRDVGADDPTELAAADDGGTEDFA